MTRPISKEAGPGPRRPTLQRPADAAVLPDAPEVHDHQHGRDERDEDAVQNVEAQQRRGPDQAAGGEQRAGVVASVDAEQIRDNARAMVQALIRAKPATAKGTYLKSITLSSTMGPGVRIDPNVFLEKTEEA